MFAPGADSLRLSLLLFFPLSSEHDCEHPRQGLSAAVALQLNLATLKNKSSVVVTHSCFIHACPSTHVYMNCTHTHTHSKAKYTERQHACFPRRQFSFAPKCRQSIREHRKHSNESMRVTSHSCPRYVCVNRKQHARIRGACD